MRKIYKVTVAIGKSSTYYCVGGTTIGGGHITEIVQDEKGFQINGFTAECLGCVYQDFIKEPDNALINIRQIIENHSINDLLEMGAVIETLSVITNHSDEACIIVDYF